MTELRFNIKFMKFRTKPLQVTFKKGIHVIYGESGSGKTAFLNHISGQELPLQRENFSMINSDSSSYLQEMMVSFDHDPWDKLCAFHW